MAVVGPGIEVVVGPGIELAAGLWVGLVVGPESEDLVVVGAGIELAAGLWVGLVVGPENEVVVCPVTESVAGGPACAPGPSSYSTGSGIPFSSSEGSAGAGSASMLAGGAGWYGGSGRVGFQWNFTSLPSRSRLCADGVPPVAIWAASRLTCAVLGVNWRRSSWGFVPSKVSNLIFLSGAHVFFSSARLTCPINTGMLVLAPLGPLRDHETLV